jgi:hypothetical protein
MLRKIIIAVGALLAAVLLYASTRPDTFEVKRTILVNATAAEVFLHINDFRKWTDWSPWEKIDPAMMRDYSGAESGIGAAYAWEGNDKVGKGRMEITTVAIPYKVGIQLDFVEPFPASNQTEFLIDPVDEGTQVTWVMSGKYNKLAKLMSVFFDMDSMVGADFEKGLANLKAVSEMPTVNTTAAEPAGGG